MEDRKNAVNRNHLKSNGQKRNSNTYTSKSVDFAVEGYDVDLDEVPQEYENVDDEYETYEE